MPDFDLQLRRKYAFRVGDRKLVLIKKPVESVRHVLMKVLLGALYLPAYPGLQVEVSIGERYKPDLVDAGPEGPCFWGEAGSVGSEKLRRLLKRFPHTHFALTVWDTGLDPLERRVRRAAKGLNRSAPVDVIRFPADAGRRFVDDRGVVAVTHADLNWRRVGPS